MKNLQQTPFQIVLLHFRFDISCELFTEDSYETQAFISLKMKKACSDTVVIGTSKVKTINFLLLISKRNAQKAKYIL